MVDNTEQRQNPNPLSDQIEKLNGYLTSLRKSRKLDESLESSANNFLAYAARGQGAPKKIVDALTILDRMIQEGKDLAEPNKNMFEGNDTYTWGSLGGIVDADHVFRHLIATSVMSANFTSRKKG